MNKISGDYQVPGHVAIIMDGNARWAKKHGRAKLVGYQEGMRTAKNIISYSKHIGIKYLTLFIFSLENWQRPHSDVKIIMSLLREYLIDNVLELLSEDMEISFIGNLSRLDKDIRDQIKHIAEASKKPRYEFKLRLAISYGARNEIINSVIALIQKYQNKKYHLDKKHIEKKFLALLNVDNFPELDLLIRTSGEYRLSNFLLWELAYTELIFVNKLWPEFTNVDLQKAINIFNMRNRRFGQ